MDYQYCFNLPIHRDRHKYLRRQHMHPEQHLWRALRTNQLGVRFKHQHNMGQYIVDFYCAKCCLVIEIDAEHLNTESAQTYNAKREAYLYSLGFTILRFNHLEVMQNIDHILQQIHLTIHSS